MKPPTSRSASNPQQEPHRSDRNGAKVQRHIEQDAVAAASAAVEGHIRALRCPGHGTLPTRITATPVGTDLEWRVEGCCDALIAAVQGSLR